MKFKIANIGMINKAEIELNGITTIGGVNKSGKSTIAKVFRAYLELLNENDSLVFHKSLEINRIIREKFVSLTKELNPYIKDDRSRIIIMRALNHPFYMIDNISKSIFLGEISSIYLIVDKSIENIKALFAIDAPENIYQLLEKYSNEIYKKIESVVKSDSLYGSLFFYNKSISWFENYFLGDIRNKYDTLNESLLEIDFLSLNFSNRITNINEEIYQKKNIVRYNLLYKDQKNPIDFINYSKFPFEMSYENYNRDYFGNDINKVKKLLEEKETDLVSDIEEDAGERKISDIIQKISRVIGCELKRDSEEANFYRYYDSNNHSYNLSNIASGVKVFSLLILFLENYSLYINPIIILDEPETSLHPEWQIFLTEILSDLTTLGFKILIITHSPYIIQGIDFYTRDFQDNKSKFYCTELIDQNCSNIIDVTDNKEELFKKLSVSLNKVMY